MRKLIVELALLMWYPPGLFLARDDRGSRWIFDRARRAGSGRPAQFRLRRDVPDRYEIWHDPLMTRAILCFCVMMVVARLPSPVGLLGLLGALPLYVIRNGRVVADESGVVSYGWLTADRYDWDDIEEFVVVDDRVEMVLRSGSRVTVDQPDDSVWPGDRSAQRHRALRASQDKLAARRPA